MEFSVMTYRSYVGSNAALHNEPWGYAQTYMMNDIAALQWLYGADFTTGAGDTTYAWSPDDGVTRVDGAAAIVPQANRIFATIWDGGGHDAYDLSAYATGVVLDLGPGRASTFSADQLASLGGGPNDGYARGRWEQEPLKALAADGQLVAYHHDGFWRPMDTLKDKRDLEAAWQAGTAPWKTMVTGSAFRGSPDPAQEEFDRRLVERFRRYWDAAAVDFPLIVAGMGRWGRVLAGVAFDARGSGSNITLLARSNTARDGEMGGGTPARGQCLLVVRRAADTPGRWRRAWLCDRRIEPRPASIRLGPAARHGLAGPGRKAVGRRSRRCRGAQSCNGDGTHHGPGDRVLDAAGVALDQVAPARPDR